MTDDEVKYVTVTASDFDVVWDAEHTFPFFEDENANGLWGYGHHDPAEFCRLVNLYDGINDPQAEDWYGVGDVEHGYMRASQPLGYPDGEWIISKCNSQDWLAFPATWISR